MFSVLNTQFAMGKQGTRMCKILDSLSTFFHGVGLCFSRSFYLVEGDGFKSGHFTLVGNRIALLIRQPVLIRIG